MTEDAILIFTGYSAEQVRLEGESRAWVLSAERARDCRYSVLCYNENSDFSTEQMAGGTGFLVGLVAGIVPSREVAGRWCVRFSEVAQIAIPALWPGHQMPIHYTSMEKLGIDPMQLIFKPVGMLE